MQHLNLNPPKHLIEEALKDNIIEWQSDNTALIASVTIANSIKILQQHQQLELSQLVDITAIDYPDREQRFEVLYSLLSLRFNYRFFIKVRVNSDESIPTLSKNIAVANWLEREVYDMFGIIFQGHDDLRRLLSDYNFAGHPLRKDFPLSGYVQLRYDPFAKRIIEEEANRTQEYRDFDFISPWEGMINNNDKQLPGDEKASDKQADNK
jgi:NADH-quinone oxidoreductase subunit C